MKNKKGFTLVELLAVIVILAVIILIAVNAVLPQMRKARRNSFTDEVINFGKAAETKYVADSISQPEDENQRGVQGTDSDGHMTMCYTVAQLKGTYVSKNDDKYAGKVVLTIDGDNITKAVTMTNEEFFVNGVNTATKDFTVSDYTSTDWNAITSTCTAATPNTGN